MKNLTYKEIRTEYLKHLVEHGHQEIPSTSLVPENDPTVLYVPAGMFPLVPFLLGEEHPKGKRLADSQRCIRTIDIDEVGDPHHCTSFEMLGNWSLNDYFKEEAINITVSFLVEKLGFNPNELYASVFAGDKDAPKDEESIRVWKEVFNKHGIISDVGGSGKRIQEFGKKECWWELPEGGPCGPCSEIFYDTGKEPCSKQCNVNCNCGKYLEIGNNVFMEYLKKDGNY
ncbi:alanine--tRNA ligase, partial [Candidatus Dojkabacteria bacterium]|nr:alanine--tRNA ligase [Candidatus Dojkabacteria bacterium]